MAGNSLRRLWSWISFVILPGCLLLSNTERAPCAVAYPSNVTEDDSVPPPASEAEVIVFLRESCDGEANVTDIQDFFDRSNYDARITVMPASCEYFRDLPARLPPSSCCCCCCFPFTVPVSSVVRNKDPWSRCFAARTWPKDDESSRGCSRFPHVRRYGQARASVECTAVYMDMPVGVCDARVVPLTK